MAAENPEFSKELYIALREELSKAINATIDKITKDHDLEDSERVTLIITVMSDILGYHWAYLMRSAENDTLETLKIAESQLHSYIIDNYREMLN